MLLVENVVSILVCWWLWDAVLILGDNWVNDSGSGLVEHNIRGNGHKVALELVGLHADARFLAMIILIL